MNYQCYNDDNNIYMVDMMFAYINLMAPPTKSLKIETLLPILQGEIWGNTRTGIKYSPQDVLNAPSKYKKEMARIQAADLTYPIIVWRGDIVDGVHRLCKAISLNKHSINAYIFDDALMKKFVVVKGSVDYKNMDSLRTHQVLELFIHRFKLMKP